MDKIAVLIPAYNEAVAIGQVIRDYKAALPEAVIYVYDNNSSDDTAKIAEQEGAVVRYEYMQGKGSVVRRMFREIEAQVYLMVDGDGTYPADKAREMAELVLEKNVDMVVGDRLSSTYFTENKRAFHNFGNVLVRKSINTLFKSDIQDVLTGMRAFSYLFVKSFPVISAGFEIETEMSIHAVENHMSIANVPVMYRDRAEGDESKLNTFSDGFKVLLMIFVLFRNCRPFKFFMSIATVLIIVSVALLVPIIITFVNSHTVPKFPTLIAISSCALLAFMSFFQGMVLDVLRHKKRQDFEMRLIDIENRYKGYNS